MAFTNNNDHRAMMSDINVTPLVDVMLVLLIIFMISAPMMTQGLDVNLPEVKTKVLPEKGERLIITIMADGKVFLDKFPVPNDSNIGLKVKRMMETKKAKDVILRADKDVPYGYVAVTMGSLKEAGITAIGLATDPEAMKKPGDKDKQS